MTSDRPAPPSPGELDFCYLTTTGRLTGRPHRIEIWFALIDATVYLLSGGGTGSDWVRNLVAEPAVTLELAGLSYPAQARVVDDDAAEAGPARHLVYEKYRRGYEGSLERWRDSALLVAVDLAERP